MKKLLLIDGSSLLHRAFYALPLLSNTDGVFTNAVHGFMMMFNKALSQQQPTLVAVAFDKSRVTFRTRIDPAYKGTRSATPVELKGQFELIKQALKLSGVRWLELDDFEADDIIGTLAARGSTAGCAVEILSGDRDLLQLVDDNVSVYLTKKGISDIERYDAAAVQERFGCLPPHLIDLKGLMGDSSDNIPGVPGVGEKTAMKLLSQFPDLDTLYAHLDEVSGDKLRQKLADNRESALRSRELATICREAPLNEQPDDLALRPADPSALAEFYARLGLRQLLRGLEQSGAAVAKAEPSADFLQQEERPWPTAEECVQKSDAPLVEAAAVQKTDAAPEPIPDTLLCLLPTDEGLLIAGGGLDAQQVSGAQIERFRALFEDAALPKLAWDAKRIAHVLAPAGIRLAGLRDDALIAAYLLDPARSDYRLDELFSEYGLPQGGADVQCAALAALCAQLREKLAAASMLSLYEQMELPLTQVLAQMEQTGVRVERARLAELSQQLSTSRDQYQQRIFELSGHEFNLNSPKQLGVVLFEEMGLPPLKKTKTGYSTDSEVLESLAPMFEVARLLLDYRLAAKLHSTYTEGLAKLIAPDGRIHTTFTQTVTATGRLSSVEPNLQNIPVRQELGRQIRQVFLSDSPQHLLLAADYNQIELRILAHVSGDPRLRQSYVDGEDIHARTASEVMGVALDQVTPEQRRAAKAVNFGIVYGISDYGLSRDLGISRHEAKQYIDAYFERYPGVAQYQRQTILAAREHGYAETLFGRRRYLPDLNNRNFNLRSFAERMAINAPIQGSAADIIKLAMVRVQHELERSDLRAAMLLQVHDELIFDVPADDLPRLAALVRDKMEHAAELSVPLTVEIKSGYDWYHMEKVK